MLSRAPVVAALIATVLLVASRPAVAQPAEPADDCIARDRASLEIEEQPYVRLHLSSCLASEGRITDAIRAAKLALEAGMKSGDSELVGAARPRLQELLGRLAHVTIRRKAGGPALLFDGRQVPENVLGRRVAIDPGTHHIEADAECLLSEDITVAEGEERTVDVGECRPRPPYLPPPIESRIDATVGLSMSAYADTNHVNVFTPALNAELVSSRGWSLVGSYLVDVISSASPDVVSTASPGFNEVRHQVTGGGRYRIGRAGVELATKVSSEPDCLSVKGGGAFTLDLEDATIIPRIGYAHREDRIGVRGTPFSELERRLSVNDFELGTNVLLSPRTLLVTAATLETMRGDPSSPYRYVPVFGADVAPSVSPGASPELVNMTRLAVRPREQLPTERDRFALAARINHRLYSGTLRLEERAYVDTWGIKATTTDARYIHDAGRRLRIGPHLRVHGQSAASFYRLAYVGDDVALPLYRTTVRELSPMLAFTAGGTARVLLNGEEANPRFSLVLSGDVSHARYFESLYVTSRTAFYGTLGFEAEL